MIGRASGAGACHTGAARVAARPGAAAGPARGAARTGRVASPTTRFEYRVYSSTAIELSWERAPEALERVAEAFSLGAGVGLDAMYAAAERVLSRPESVPGFTRARPTEPAPGDASVGARNCPNGGTVEVFPSAVEEDRTTSSLDAADGGFGDVRVTGDFEGTFDLVRPALPARNRRWEVAGYRFRDARPGGVVVETGGDTVVRAALPDGSDPEYIWAANLYRVTTPTGSYGRAGEVVVFDSLVDRDDPGAPPGLTVDLQRRRDGESEAYTGTPFRRATDGAPGYRTGTLSVYGRIGRDGPGYRYRLQSENGDPATFQLDVTEGIGATREGGTTTSYTVPGSDRFDFGTFDPSSVDFGL